MINVGKIKEVQNAISKTQSGGWITSTMMDVCKVIGQLNKEMGIEGFVEVLSPVIPLIQSVDSLFKKADESEDGMVDPSEIALIYPHDTESWIYNLTLILMAIPKAIKEVQRYDMYLKKEGIKIDLWEK